MKAFTVNHPNTQTVKCNDCGETITKRQSRQITIIVRKRVSEKSRYPVDVPTPVRVCKNGC